MKQQEAIYPKDVSFHMVLSASQYAACQPFSRTTPKTTGVAFKKTVAENTTRITLWRPTKKLQLISGEVQLQVKVDIL